MKKVVNYIKDFFNGLSIHHISTYSAASTYAIFIGVIPFLIIILTLIPITPISEEQLIKTLTIIMPNSSYSFINSVVESLYEGSTGVLSISIIALLYSSSYAFVYIREGLNHIYSIKEKKNYLLVRIILSAFILIVISALVILSFLGVLSLKIESILVSKGIKIGEWLSTILDYRQVIVIVGLFLLFEVLYVFVPAKKNKIVNEIPGAILATILSWISLRVFNILLDTYFSFTMYGSLASIVIVLFYFYICFYIFFVGAYFNVFIKEKNI